MEMTVIIFYLKSGFGRPDFIFINKVANNSTQYSITYVEFIENKIKNNPNYIVWAFISWEK